jgi:hypothetical protein
MYKNLAFAVNYDLRAKFLRKFLPSLVKGSRAAWCGGASGDEGKNYIIRGESTIGYIENYSALEVFKPGRSRSIFLYIKILSMPSLGGEVKQCVPCPNFAACKRTSHLQ